MKKIRKIVIILITSSILFVGCEQSSKPVDLAASTISLQTATVSPMPSPTPTAPETNKIVFTEREPDRTYDQITDLISLYQKNLADAINMNFFAIVEPNLLAGSPLYKSQKSLVTSLFSRKIKERFVSSDIYRYYSLDNNQYKVEVSEKVEVDYPDKDPVTNEYHWLYTVESKDGKLQLSQIEEWTTFQNDMDLLLGGAKGDGYYAEEFLHALPLQLEKAINTLDISALKQLSKNETVVQTLKALISELRKGGSNYSLNVKSVNEDWNTLTFVEELSYQFTDKYQNKQNGSRKMTIQFEEIRENYQGHAVISKLEVD